MHETVVHGHTKTNDLLCLPSGEWSHKFQVLQNKVMRLAVKATRFPRNSQIHRELDVSQLQDYRTSTDGLDGLTHTPADTKTPPPLSWWVATFDPAFPPDVNILLFISSYLYCVLWPVHLSNQFI